MANEIPNTPQEWWNNVYLEHENRYQDPIQRSQCLAHFVRESLDGIRRPAAFQSVEDLQDLKEAIKARDPDAARETEGLVDDLVADIQGKDGADVALLIRREKYKEVAGRLGSVQSKEGLLRTWRALLELSANTTEIDPFELQSFVNNLFSSVPDKEIASVINRYQIPLRTLYRNLGSQAKSVCLALAPHLTYANLDDLPEKVQEEILEACSAKDLQYLTISSGSLKTLPKGMTALRKLDCWGCGSLTDLPDGMVALQELNCNSCTSLTKLPAGMRALQTLWCSNCTKLTKLPNDMAALRVLMCEGCTKLTELPNDMAALERLYCNLCDSLTKLPAGMTALLKLDCRACDNLTELPNDMAALQHLKCSSCYSLTKLPSGMETLQSLKCAYCRNLTELPDDMAALRKLDCTGCSKLERLPANLLVLEFLDCWNCPRLTSLPANLPVLVSLMCRDCDRLASLPAALPQCRYLNFLCCPLLRDAPTPEGLPADAEVYRDGMMNQDIMGDTWQVPIEEVHLDPKAFLCELGVNWLLKERPFPSVSYLEPDGSPFLGIDWGGVRRDAVSRILLHLFRNDLEEGKALSRTVDLMPVWSKKVDDEEQKTAYRSIARLMALSYNKVCNLVTGPLFSERVYQALLTEANSLDRATVLMDLEEELVKLAADEEPPNDEVDQAIKKKIHYYLDPSYENFADEEEAWESYKKEPGSLKKAILADLNHEKGQWVPINKAIDAIREELRKALGPATWNEVQGLKVADLQQAIEGELSAEALWNHLDWKREGQSSQEELQKTKAYFEKWLDGVSEKDLQIFVRAVTGNLALSPKRISIQIFQRGPEKLPSAHSCFSSLELSGQLENQATFNKKMELFLENALAGSGFQFS